jgi:hypothetical protein
MILYLKCYNEYDAPTYGKYVFFQSPTYMKAILVKHPFKSTFKKERNNNMVKNNHKKQDMSTLDNWVDKVVNRLMFKKNIKFGLRLLKFSFLIIRPWMKGPSLMICIH